jgi:hypothetical protein
MTMKPDPWPLLPRSGTMDTIQAARAHLDRVERALGSELTAMAVELDRLRTALTREQREHAAARMAWAAEMEALRTEIAALRGANGEEAAS